MPIGLHIMEVEERIRVTGEGEQVSKEKWKKCRIENTTSCMKNRCYIPPHQKQRFTSKASCSILNLKVVKLVRKKA